MMTNILCCPVKVQSLSAIVLVPVIFTSIMSRTAEMALDFHQGMVSYEFHCLEKKGMQEWRQIVVHGCIGGGGFDGLM